MRKNNLEDYKRAIREKYKLEITGVYSDFLINPSRAKLRKLCLEIFELNPSQNDLKIFASFFRFDFLPNSSGKLKEQTDKFRPIETFFKGKTDLVNIEAINLAAILVDFQPRPYIKFLKTNFRNTIIGETNEIVNTSLEHTVRSSQKINQFLNKYSAEKKTKKLLLTAGVGGVILSLGFALSYFVFPKKQCIQWSNDHYEIVNCDLEAPKFRKSNTIEPLEKGTMNLKKIQACDTATFFGKREKVIIWYPKSEKGINLQNIFRERPENDELLTNYLLYLKQIQEVEFVSICFQNCIFTYNSQQRGFQRQ